ncbi:MAG: hypothetical protein A3D92_10190 [Bacteroidetes bacterium RIFCSPHIGHO2_02_FULL_44_7]|nr:MAG: hypothetical protein A3D92_10190 [Bacteroidetes bacterium RIFCSPHIGHO2_02_FULL_44_7]
MLTVLWLLYSISHLIFHTADRSHYRFVPNDADLVVAVNTQELMEQGFNDLLFQSQDASILELLKSEFEDRDFSGNQLETGIDLSGDILFFTIRYKSRPLTGILFSLSDEAAFKKEMARILDPNFEASAHLPKVGMLLRQMDAGFSAKELKRICTALFNGKHMSNAALGAQNTGGISQLIFRSIDPQNGKYNSTSLDIRLYEKGLEFQGEVHTDFSMRALNNLRTLTPEGLHLSTRIVPTELFKPADFGLPSFLPELRGISINFRGSEIIHKEFTAFIPDADVIVEFDSELSLSDILDSLVAGKFITHLTNASFRLCDRTFYFRQIDPKTVYIGRQTPGEFGVLDKNVLLQCRGDLSTLTDVQGRGIVRRFLEIVSAFTASRTFTQNTDDFQLTVKMTKKDEATIKGSLLMKEGHFATLELLRLVLTSELF